MIYLRLSGKRWYECYNPRQMPPDDPHWLIVRALSRASAASVPAIPSDFVLDRDNVAQYCADYPEQLASQHYGQPPCPPIEPNTMFERIKELLLQNAGILELSSLAAKRIDAPIEEHFDEWKVRVRLESDEMITLQFSSP